MRGWLESRLGGVAPVALVALVFAGPAGAQPAPGATADSGPKSVGVVEIREEAVPFTVELPGRAVAFEQADIRPRVEGVIEEIPYDSARRVKVGDVLFRLERDSYEATLAAAEAEVAQAESAAAAAQVTLDRYTRLEGSGVTQETVDTARVALLEAQATLKSAEATRKIAELDLDRTEIRSPIDGVPDVPTVSVGALVTANQTDALTTVTRLDPIFVDVAESSARMLRVRERIREGILVPQIATSRSATGVLTAFVAREGEAVQVTLTDAGSHGNAWIVTGGLEPGDQLIVDGLKDLRAGDAVEPVAVTIGPDGVVQPTGEDG